MKILAIETTGSPSSVAVLEDNKNLGEFTLNSKMNHSETILPLTRDLLKMLKIELSDIDYIACSNGPGSFTGLRIGASTAKAFAHGANKKLIMVPTLDAIAYNVLDSGHLIVPIMDARRGQVYSCIYSNQKGFERLEEYMTVEFVELLEILNKYSQKAIFLGDGIFVHEKLILENGHSIAPSNMNMQRASSVAYCAKKLIEEGKAVDYNDFELMYLRKPQAEREYEVKIQNDRNSTL